jgi:hypothetical protein
MIHTSVSDICISDVMYYGYFNHLRMKMERMKYVICSQYNSKKSNVTLDVFIEMQVCFISPLLFLPLTLQTPYPLFIRIK